MPIKPITRKSTKGFTLIEILIAALVLGIGILGLATLMLTSLKSDQSAFYRSVASTLAYDMADRIRQNRDGAEAGRYDAIDTSDDAPTNPNCSTNSSGCSATQTASLDIREWANNFTNVGSASNYVSPLPNGVGTVTRTDNEYTITITWSEVDWDEDDPNQRVATTENLTLTMSL